VLQITEESQVWELACGSLPGTNSHNSQHLDELSNDSGEAEKVSLQWHDVNDVNDHGRLPPMPQPALGSYPYAIAFRSYLRSDPTSTPE